MDNKIKQIIFSNLKVEVLNYEDDDNTYVRLSDDTVVYEKDLLEKTIDTLKESLNEAIYDNSFHYAREVLDSLEDIIGYYKDEWCA